MPSQSPLSTLISSFGTVLWCNVVLETPSFSSDFGHIVVPHQSLCLDLVVGEQVESLAREIVSWCQKFLTCGSHGKKKKKLGSNLCQFHLRLAIISPAEGKPELRLVVDETSLAQCLVGASVGFAVDVSLCVSLGGPVGISVGHSIGISLVVSIGMPIGMPINFSIS